MTNTTTTITAAAGDLRPAVTALGKVVKRTANLPVLACLRVDPVSRNRFRLTGTDSGTHFTIEIPGEVPQKVPHYLIPLERLKERLRGAKAGERIDLHPGSKAPPVEEFPEAPAVRGRPIELDPRFLEALHRALACASSDETRYILNGALVDPDGKSIVGTDGRHLYAAEELRLPGLKEPVILPRLPRADYGSVRIDYTPSLRLTGPGEPSGARHFRLDGANWCLTGQLIDGNYPNYRQVIPDKEKFRTRVTLPAEVLDPLAKAIRRMPGGKSDNRPVGLRIRSKLLGVVAREDDETTFEEIEVPLESKTGPPITVFVNRDYLLKALAFGMTRIAIIDGVSPIRCAGDGDSLIVMPVRIAGDLKVSLKRALEAVLSVNGTRRRKRPPEEPPVTPPPPTRPRPKPPAQTTPATQTATPMNGNTNRTTNGNNKHPTPPSDPMDAAAGHIGEIKDALRAAMTSVNALAASLKATRQQQRQAERDMRTVRSTLKSLQKVEI